MGKLVFPLFVIFMLSISIPGSHCSTLLSSQDITKWLDKIPQAKEKVTHLHFYLHDVLSGSTPSAYRVAESAITNTSQTNFGLVTMIDDPLTEGPNLTSKIVGRAQGLWGSAGLEEFRLVMAVNFVFTTGEFNGSTLSVLANNPALVSPREIPIVGGTGAFRLARGFAWANNYAFNLTTGDATVEYDIVVFHY